MDTVTTELAHLLAKADPVLTPGPDVGEQAADLFRSGSMRSWRTQLHRVLADMPWEAHSLELELTHGTSTLTLVEAILRHFRRIGRMPRHTMQLMTDILELRDPLALQRLDELVGLTDVEQRAMQAVIREVFTNSGRAIARATQAQAAQSPRTKTLHQRMRFTMTNEAAIEHANIQAGALVSRINADTLRTVRATIHQAVQGALTPQQAAKVVRTRVGLLPAHVTAVQRLQAATLKATGSAAQAELVAARASQRLLNYRANNIARTEILDAQNAGQLAHWKDKIARGDLPQETNKRWVIAHDERLCKRCATMVGERAVVPVWGQFLVPTGKGGFVYLDAPPSHPSCRCAIALDLPGFLTPGMQEAIITGDPSYAEREALAPPLTEIELPELSKLLAEIESDVTKFNPNHDELGRFAGKTYGSGAWGYSRDISSTITAAAAHMMGAYGYNMRTSDEGRDHAKRLLRAIVRSPRSDEPLHHVASGKLVERFLNLREGQRIKLAPTATSGNPDPEAGAGYLDRSQRGQRHVRLIFESGAPATTYGKHRKTRDEPWRSGEAIVAGEFKVAAIKDGTGYEWFDHDAKPQGWVTDPFTDIHLAPRRMFDPDLDEYVDVVRKFNPNHDDLGRFASAEPGVQIEYSDRGTHVELSLIRTAEAQRGQGKAQRALAGFLGAADAKGVPVSLSPEPLAGDRRTSKAKLTAWYRSHGFIPNRGRRAMPEASGSMIRYPQGVAHE